MSILVHPLICVTKTSYLPQVLLRLNKTLWIRLQRGYMVQSQFDSQSPSSPNNDIEECGLGFHIASDTKPPREFLLHVQSPSTEMREASTVRPLPEIRPPSILSNVSSSASTLVAEDGSNTARSRGLRRLGFKVCFNQSYLVVIMFKTFRSPVEAKAENRQF